MIDKNMKEFFKREQNTLDELEKQFSEEEDYYFLSDWELATRLNRVFKPESQQKETQ